MSESGISGIGLMGANDPELLEAAPGVPGLVVLGVPGLNLPLTEDRNPPDRSAIKHPNSPSFPALSLTASLSVCGIFDNRYCMGADTGLKGVCRYGFCVVSMALDGIPCPPDIGGATPAKPGCVAKAVCPKGSCTRLALLG